MTDGQVDGQVTGLADGQMDGQTSGGEIVQPTASMDVLPPCPAFFPQAALVRRVPWPAAHTHAPLNPAVQTLRVRPDSLPCVRLAYTFFFLPAAQAQALLELALGAAGLVLAAEFKLAERNLELPATLAAGGLMALAGRGIFSGRQIPADNDFMRLGGIEGLVRQSRATVLERRTLLGGAAALLHLRRA